MLSGDKKEIIDHISLFPAMESHYCRQNTQKKTHFSMFLKCIVCIQIGVKRMTYNPQNNQHTVGFLTQNLMLAFTFQEVTDMTCMRRLQSAKKHNME